MRVFRIVLAVLLICGVLFPLAVYADDSDLYSNYLNNAASGSGDDNFLLYRGNYSLDTVSMSFFKDPLSILASFFSSLIFEFQKILAELTIAIFAFVLEMNIAQVLSPYVTPFLSAIEDSIWGTLAVFAIGMGGFTLLAKMIMNRTSQALAGLISIVAIITAAMVFFNQPTLILEKVDGVTDEVGKAILTSSYQAYDNRGVREDEISSVASGVIWNLLVHQPWQILNFGSISKAQQYEDEILIHAPDSSTRERTVKDLNSSDGLFSKSLSYQNQRLVTAILLLVFSVILMAVLIVFSLLLFVFRFSAFIFMLMGVFVFFLAIFPTYGTSLVKKWICLILGASFSRILVFFFLSILLVFMQVIYGMVDEHGLLSSLFMIFAMSGTIFLQRKKILGLFAAMKSGHMASQMRSGMNRMLNFDPSAGQWGHMVHDVETDTFNTIVKMEEGLEHQIEKITHRHDKPAQQQSMRANIPASDDAPEVIVTLEQYEYARIGKEALWGAYDRNAGSASVAGGEINNPFIVRTNSAREASAAEFSSEDLSIAIQAAKNHVKAGKDPEQFSLHLDEDGSFVKENIQRPVDLREEAIIERPASLDVGSERKNTRRPYGIAYFQEHFGEEKGEAVYEEMAAKFDKNLVDQYWSSDGDATYLSVMKDIQMLSADMDVVIGGTKEVSPSEAYDAFGLPDLPELGNTENAEAKLKEAYEISKKKAERAAKKNQTEPTYSSFVERTDAVRESNAGQFHKYDLAIVNKILDEMEKDGVPPDRVQLENQAGGWQRRVVPENKNKQEEAKKEGKTLAKQKRKPKTPQTAEPTETMRGGDGSDGR